MYPHIGGAVRQEKLFFLELVGSGVGRTSLGIINVLLDGSVLTISGELHE